MLKIFHTRFFSESFSLSQSFKYPTETQNFVQLQWTLSFHIIGCFHDFSRK